MNSEKTVKTEADVIEDIDAQVEDVSLEEVVGGTTTYDPDGQPSRITFPSQD